MRQIALLIIFIFSTFISFSQKQNITVTKKDGTVLSVKRYSSKVKYLKLVFENETTQELSYNQLDKIEYEYKDRKKVEKITEQFVRMSERNGSMMKRVVSGECNLYENLGYQSVTYYYAKKDTDKVATKLGSNSFMDVANYKKAALEYFKDCPSIIKKIKKKFKRKKIKELVEFYNNNCL
ncbi:hypothetical protein BWZ20_15045 [Winogradskyella sp. J14-2]|uniref:hypothetical protein n=1 Tax=Winogradskyella sp. J14-2 TaxID=1936080 RepID=UPI000972BE12|nr:hypothetical protein [Winogradskyella sp. J14-2]APY09537.1 hypothetical protein BWZ20_15045 [Winogradskyella sp. J14-2]